MAALALLVMIVLAAGYRLYGGWAATQFALDDGRTTPAVSREDGADFVPTSPFYLMGQHFSAIAAAGPIAGPILAAQQFGRAGLEAPSGRCRGHRPSPRRPSRNRAPHGRLIDGSATTFNFHETPASLPASYPAGQHIRRGRPEGGFGAACEEHSTR